MMFMFFVNKPISLVLYLLGLIMLILFVISYRYEDIIKFMILVLFFPSYNILYNACLWYYLLRSKQKMEIKGVDIRKLKGVMSGYFILYAISFIIGLILSQELFIIAFYLCIYSVVSYVILKCVIFAKFISLGLKQNSTLKDFKMEEMYEEIREIMLKKIVS
jgi:hypothetical protein